MRVKQIVIGTRGSALALAQASLLKARLEEISPETTIEIRPIKTEGDRKQGTPQAAQSDKRDWIIDLERALLAREIDLALHCGKDVPDDLEAGTELASILKRATPFDAFIGRLLPNGERLAFADLPHGAIVGTASLRRKASLRAYRSDLIVRDHRGNVPTRVRKLDESEDLSGIVVAVAGLERLALNDIRYEVLPQRIMLPSMNQGTLVTQTRIGDSTTSDLLAPLRDPHTTAEFDAERAVAKVLGGDCHSAISIFACVNSPSITIECRIFSHDGVHVVTHSISGSTENARELGTTLGAQILDRGGAHILEQ